MTCILYNYFAPAYKAGGPIQSIINLVAALGEDSDVFVICSNTDVDGTVTAVAANRWASYFGIRVFYSTGFFDYSNQLREASVLFINGIFSLHYNLLPMLWFKGRKIVSVRGMLTTGGLQQKRLKKSIYISLLKLIGIHRRCEFHATNHSEAADIYRVFGDNIKVWVIPNLAKAVNMERLPEKKPESLVIATVALISAMKNHLSVLAALQDCSQTVVYEIYGAIKDAIYWAKCKQAISRLPANIQVNYHGDILPEYTHAAISACHVYIQPSVSENFGHSIIEALMTGRPVITSYNTPWNELVENNAGMNVSVDDVTQIGSAISFFAQLDEAELGTWSEGARLYAECRNETEKTKNEYIKMFAK